MKGLRVVWGIFRMKGVFLMSFRGLGWLGWTVSGRIPHLGGLGPLGIREVNDYEHDLVTKNSTALWRGLPRR